MTYKHVWLGTLAVVAICLIVGITGFFVNRQAEINRVTELEIRKSKNEASVKTAEITQAAKTARTKERWGWTQRIPGFKGDGQKSD